MREVMGFNNMRSIHESVEDTLREARNKEWIFDQFIAMARWRPSISDIYFTKNFMKQMKEKILRFLTLANTLAML
jgi:hypothetical protein